MWYRKINTMLLFLIIFNYGFSQDADYINNNDEAVKKLGLTIGCRSSLLADPFLLYVGLDYFVVPALNAEVNLTYNYASAGLTYYHDLSKESIRLKAYGGILFGHEEGIMIAQIPVGAGYFFKNNWN